MAKVLEDGACQGDLIAGAFRSAGLCSDCGDGTVEVAQLARVIRRLDPGTWADADLDRLLGDLRAAAGGAGRISVEQFVAWLCASGDRAAGDGPSLSRPQVTAPGLEEEVRWLREANARLEALLPPGAAAAAAAAAAAGGGGGAGGGDRDRFGQPGFACIAAVFRDLDRNGDGFICRGEVTAALREGTTLRDLLQFSPRPESGADASHVTWEEVQAVLDTLDSSGDGLISLAEFMAFFYPVPPHHDGEAAGLAVDLCCSKAHWGYEGHNGPPVWARLSHRNHLAATGKRQSPINLVPGPRTLGGAEQLSARSHADVVLRYTGAPATIRNNGHTVVIYWKGGGMDIGGVQYNVRQFHFHAPSEHTLRGRQYPLEMHLVHSTDEPTPRLAVLGIFFEERLDVGSPFLSQFWDHLPTDVRDKPTPLPSEVEGRSLNTAVAQGYFRYEGSLTTPPCSEGLEWTVAADAMSVSPSQVAAFRTILGGVRNFRPTQPLHDRVVRYIVPPGAKPV